MKPGGGHCLSQQPRNWNISPCVNVEVNELSSVLCRAWKNTNAVLASFLKANPKCHSVSAPRETVTGTKRVNIHRLWEISLEWKKITAMDFCFSEVTYPFENPTKAMDPFPALCPFSICKMHIHVTFSHPWGSLKGHSLRLKIPVTVSDWKLNRNKLIRGDKEAQVR